LDVVKEKAKKAEEVGKSMEEKLEKYRSL